MSVIANWPGHMRRRGASLFHRDAASGFVGYVTRFRVRADYLARYDVQTVGRGRLHEEYWIPAEDLAEFNANIVGSIEVVAEFRGAPR